MCSILKGEELDERNEEEPPPNKHEGTLIAKFNDEMYNLDSHQN